MTSSPGPEQLKPTPAEIAEVRASADQGDADAQSVLGIWHATGRHVLQDDAEAIRWYRLVAEQRQECTFRIELREMGIWSHS